MTTVGGAESSRDPKAQRSSKLSALQPVKQKTKPVGKLRTARGDEARHVGGL